MFTMCIYFSTLTKKTLVYVWWGIKKIPWPQVFYHARTARPGSDVPKSANVYEP